MKLRKNGYRHGGGWKPRPFEEKKRQVTISGIKQKHIKEFESLALELKELFLLSKENEESLHYKDNRMQ